MSSNSICKIPSLKRILIFMLMFFPVLFLTSTAQVQITITGTEPASMMSSVASCYHVLCSNSLEPFDSPSYDLPETNYKPSCLEGWQKLEQHKDPILSNCTLYLEGSTTIDRTIELHNVDITGFANLVTGFWPWAQIYHPLKPGLIKNSDSGSRNAFDIPVIPYDQQPTAPYGSPTLNFKRQYDTNSHSYKEPLLIFSGNVRIKNVVIDTPTSRPPLIAFSSSGETLTLDSVFLTSSISTSIPFRGLIIKTPDNGDNKDTSPPSNSGDQQQAGSTDTSTQQTGSQISKNNSQSGGGGGGGGGKEEKLSDYKTKEPDDADQPLKPKKAIPPKAMSYWHKMEKSDIPVRHQAPMRNLPSRKQGPAVPKKPQKRYPPQT